jgi:hypothetical protein
VDGCAGGAAVGEHLAHAAQRIGAVPGPRAALDPRQALLPVAIARSGAARAVFQYLAQRRDEILGVAGGCAVRGLTRKYAVAGVAVAGRGATGSRAGQAAEGVVAQRVRAFIWRIAGRPLARRFGWTRGVP